MKEYTQKIGSIVFRYFYDRNIRFWTVTRFDATTGRELDETEYFNDKSQMLDVHPKFNFKTKIVK